MQKKSGVKEYATYKEYLEQNPPQEHLREDSDESAVTRSADNSAPTAPSVRGRGGRVMVRAPRGRPA